MKDRVLALIFVGIGFATLNFSCIRDFAKSDLAYLEYVSAVLEAFNHEYSNCPCIEQRNRGQASLRRFHPLGRSDSELKKVIGIA